MHFCFLCSQVRVRFDSNLNQTIFPNYINSLIGGLFGYSIIWSIIFFYKKIRKKEGMGLGDAKLMTGIGLLFGWQAIPFVLFISAVLGLNFVTPSLINKKKNLRSKIPFGPFIITACFIYFIYGDFLYSLILV